MQLSRLGRSPDPTHVSVSSRSPSAWRNNQAGITPRSLPPAVVSHMPKCHGVLPASFASSTQHPRWPMSCRAPCINTGFSPRGPPAAAAAVHRGCWAARRGCRPGPATRCAPDPSSSAAPAPARCLADRYVQQGPQVACWQMTGLHPVWRTVRWVQRTLQAMVLCTRGLTPGGGLVATMFTIRASYYTPCWATARRGGTRGRRCAPRAARR